MGDFALSIMWDLVVKLIAFLLSPLVEWIKKVIARYWYRKLTWIELKGEYRNDDWAFKLEAELEVLAAGFFDGRIKCLKGKIKNTLEKWPKDAHHQKGETATETVEGVEGVNIHLITMSIVDNPNSIVPSFI